MASDWDRLVAKANAQRDEARHEVGKLYLERDTLQDTLATSTQVDLHDMARTRLADVQERIPPAEAQLQMCENGVALVEKLRADYERSLVPAVGDRPPEQAPPDGLGTPETSETPKMDAVTSMVKEGETPTEHTLVGMQDTPSYIAKPEPTLDPVLAGALLVAVGKDAIDSARTAYQEQAERRALEPAAAAAMSNHQHGQQLEEVQQLQQQNHQQRVDAGAQVQALALDGAALQDFWRQEFTAEVERTRAAFAGQDAERAGLPERTDDQARQVNDTRYAAAHDICQAEAHREIIDPQVQRYADARGAGAGQQQVYRELLTDMEAPQLEKRTRELEVQHFPELTPPLSIGGVDGPGGPAAPGLSGPDPSPPIAPAEPAVQPPDRNDR
ncbi:MAG: hypothetical protein IT483_02815 [Gammaproteobacteria bacterium]|nr:hypothetical protein [Gammaproteobacteria bacterium]